MSTGPWLISEYWTEADARRKAPTTTRRMGGDVMDLAREWESLRTRGCFGMRATCGKARVLFAQPKQ
jgi:hypothetical protein